MKKRSSIIFIRSLLLFLAMSLLSMGGTATLTAQASDGSKPKQSGRMVTADKTDAAAIPPIDTVLSANSQTASFGLG